MSIVDPFGSPPHPGLEPTAIDEMLVNGVGGWYADIGRALTAADIAFDLDGTSTVSLGIEDDRRTMLMSPMIAQKSVVSISGLTFVLADVKKSGPQLTMVMEHAVCSKLKDHSTVQNIAPGTMSRTGFVRRLCREESWIAVVTPGGESAIAQAALTVGTTAPATPAVDPSPPETYWDAAGRTMADIGWRRFPRGQNQLVVASDQYLMGGPPIYELSESSPGVDTIDFDWDIRKPLGKLTITCRAATWAFPVGTLIQVDSLGPASGLWLVSNIARSLLSASATVSCAKPSPILPEPQHQDTSQAAGVSNTSGGATNDSQVSGNASSAVRTFVNFALSKKGGPYVWGGSGPRGYDCSGLVQAAAATVGVHLPHFSDDQYNICANAGRAVSVQKGIATYGALLVRMQHIDGTGHIAISLGNGQTIEAMGTAEGICNGAATTGRFDHAALLPGIAY